MSDGDRCYEKNKARQGVRELEGGVVRAEISEAVPLIRDQKK